MILVYGKVEGIDDPEKAMTAFWSSGDPAWRCSMSMG